MAKATRTLPSHRVMVLVALLSACVSEMEVRPTAAGSMPREQAVATLERLMMASSGGSLFDFRFASVRIRSRWMDVVVVRNPPASGGASFRIPFKALNAIPKYSCSGGDCWLGMSATMLSSEGWEGGYYSNPVFDWKKTFTFAAQPKNAGRLVAAFNELSARAGKGPDLDEQAFTQKAAAWRAAEPKPPLAEAAQEQRILAESSFREKDIDGAIDHFLRALEIDPTWPDGNFNVALLLGDSADYATAAIYMNRYLLLVPDGPDSNAAREKLIIWKDKASRPTP